MLDASKCSSNGGETCPMNSTPDNAQPGLSRERETSSIPSKNGKPWIYPSEKMFFDAMKRKNHNPSESDMSSIIPIHNIVNERVWKEIKDWEALSDHKCELKLVKFKGKAKEYSLKARIWNVFGYTLPFDRHDWTVDRCGKEIDYVIDFYKGAGGGLSFYLDVRPYPNPRGLFETIRYHFNKL
jgi:cytochrome c heme-lyase